MQGLWAERVLKTNLKPERVMAQALFTGQRMEKRGLEL